MYLFPLVNTCQGKQSHTFCTTNNFFFIVSRNYREKIKKIIIILVVLGFTTLLTSQVISVAFYKEREKSDKFCS